MLLLVRKQLRRIKRKQTRFFSFIQRILLSIVHHHHHHIALKSKSAETTETFHPFDVVGQHTKSTKISFFLNILPLYDTNIKYAIDEWKKQTQKKFVWILYSRRLFVLCSAFIYVSSLRVYSSSTNSHRTPIPKRSSLLLVVWGESKVISCAEFKDFPGFLPCFVFILTFLSLPFSFLLVETKNEGFSFSFSSCSPPPPPQIRESFESSYRVRILCLFNVVLPVPFSCIFNIFETLWMKRSRKLFIALSHSYCVWCRKRLTSFVLCLLAVSLQTSSSGGIFFCSKGLWMQWKRQ